MKRLTLFQRILIVSLLLTAFNYPGQNYFQTLVLHPGPPKVLAATVSLEPVNLPTNTGIKPPYLTAQAAFVYDPDSGTILFQNNSQLKLHPASTTKIMTALVALEHYQPTDVLSIKTADQAIGNTMKLIPGDQLTFLDLLKGLLIASANDAAVAIAENYPTGYNGFISDMNNKAQDLGLLDTHYTNVSGIEGANHKTTALDLAILTKTALSNQLFSQTVATSQSQVTDIHSNHLYPLFSTNQLLGVVPGVVGVKTGWTENAGECLVTLVKRDDRQLITIVLNSTDRFGESRRLIDWAFSSHSWQTLN